MVGHAMDRGGLKDSKNAHSFFPQISRTGFWHFGIDMTSLLINNLGLIPDPLVWVEMDEKLPDPVNVPENVQDTSQSQLFVRQAELWELYIFMPKS